MSKNYAIIGGGIVGSTAAYYLARQGYQVTLYDGGYGQATKAAAGIICPWFSQRRNKAWYHSVSAGAQTYRQLVQDLQVDGYFTDNLFQETGALLLRKNDKSLARDLDLAEQRRPLAPAIGALNQLTVKDIQSTLPFLNTPYDATLVQGGGRVDGQALTQTLQAAFQQHGGQLVNKKVQLKLSNHNVQLIEDSSHSIYYDHYLLSVGAWLPELLAPLNLKVDIRPQKGQLLIYDKLPFITDNLPVIMPPGEIDLIPFETGKLIVGASHEDDKGYNLVPDQQIINNLHEQAQTWIPQLADFQPKQVRVGTRAYTSDYSVLIGKVPHFEEQLVAISGLGSSGLTSGPYLAQQWVQLMTQNHWEIDPQDYPINHYIQRETT